MTDESTETAREPKGHWNVRGEFVPEFPHAARTASESPAGDDGATTPEDARQALRAALSDSDRNAFDNFTHMAEKAPSEQAREFWQAKADEVLSEAWAEQVLGKS